MTRSNKLNKFSRRILSDSFILSARFSGKLLIDYWDGIVTAV